HRPGRAGQYRHALQHARHVSRLDRHRRQPRRRPLRRRVNALLLAAAVAAADPETLEAITVTATRVPRFAEEVPASLDVLGDPGPSPGIGLAEWLQGVPGLVVRERQNHAQDTQVSVRGFGARASFGIRGIRVLVDGIPASLPDGQAQISHVNLASADTVEVLRGPFSALDRKSTRLNSSHVKLS